MGSEGGSTLVAVSGSAQDDLFGWNVSYAGDVNGDGFDDIIVGAPGNDSERGSAYIFFGGPWFTGSLSANSANVTIIGAISGDRFGWDVSSAGNMNNDIFDDVIVGAPGNNSDTGAAYIFFGNNPMPPSIDGSNADVIINGGDAGDKFGSSVSDAGNVNNDEYDDVIVGSPGNNSDNGSAHVFCGAMVMSGFMDVNDANLSLFGESMGDKFGFSVSGGGDVNDDNYDDVVIGAPGGDKAYIYYGGDTMNSWLQTTQAEFDAGTKVHVKTEGIGEVKLESFNNIKGMMAYYNGSDVNTPRIRTWDQSAWSSWSNANIAGIDDNYWFVFKSGSVRKNEKILAVSDSTTDINVQVSDGLSWGPVLELINVMSNPDYRSFDLAYETLSGDAMLVYYNVSSGDKFPKYRIWDGFSWTNETNASKIGTDDINWVVLTSAMDLLLGQIMLLTLSIKDGRGIGARVLIAGAKQKVMFIGLS